VRVLPRLKHRVITRTRYQKLDRGCSPVELLLVDAAMASMKRDANSIVGYAAPSVTFAACACASGVGPSSAGSGAGPADGRQTCPGAMRPASTSAM